MAQIAAIVPLIMLVLPPLLGAFAGGPLFAREYEQGTQILALTQSVGPVRWWATKTAVAGAPVALALLALGFVNTWAMQPMAAFVARPMITPGFETRGLTPFAYFVLAFAIAVTVGILVRNTAAAIGATIAALHRLSVGARLLPAELSGSGRPGRGVPAGGRHRGTDGRRLCRRVGARRVFRRRRRS